MISCLEVNLDSDQFASNLDAEFAIDIDSANKMPSDDLGCLLGNGIRSTWPSPSVVRVRWSLYSDGTVLQGTSDDTVGHGASGPFGRASRTVGYFKARKVDTISLIVTCSLTVAVLR